MTILKDFKKKLLSPYFAGLDARHDILFVFMALCTFLFFFVSLVLLPITVALFGSIGTVIVLTLDVLCGVPINIKYWKWQV